MSGSSFTSKALSILMAVVLAVGLAPLPAYGEDVAEDGSQEEPSSLASTVSADVENIEDESLPSEAVIPEEEPIQNDGDDSQEEPSSESLVTTQEQDESYVAQIGETQYKSLKEAVAAANANDTIELLEDVAETGASGHASDNHNLWIDKNVTIDGQGHTIYVGSSSQPRGIAIGGSGDSFVEVAFKNVTIQNVLKQVTKESEIRCIDTRGNLGSLSLDNVKLLTTDSSGYNSQCLTIGGNQRQMATVNITNSEIHSDENGYPIVLFNPVDMEIGSTTIAGYCSILFNGDSSSQGSGGSKVLLNKCDIDCPNSYTADSQSGYASLVSPS